MPDSVRSRMNYESLPKACVFLLYFLHYYFKLFVEMENRYFDLNSPTKTKERNTVSFDLGVILSRNQREDTEGV